MAKKQVMNAKIEPILLNGLQIKEKIEQFISIEADRYAQAIHLYTQNQAELLQHLQTLFLQVDYNLLNPLIHFRLLIRLKRCIFQQHFQHIH